MASGGKHKFLWRFYFKIEMYVNLFLTQYLKEILSYLILNMSLMKFSTCYIVLFLNYNPANWLTLMAWITGCECFSFWVIKLTGF